MQRSVKNAIESNGSRGAKQSRGAKTQKSAAEVQRSVKNDQEEMRLACSLQPMKRTTVDNAMKLLLSALTSNSTTT